MTEIAVINVKSNVPITFMSLYSKLHKMHCSSTSGINSRKNEVAIQKSKEYTCTQYGFKITVKATVH